MTTLQPEMLPGDGRAGEQDGSYLRTYVRKRMSMAQREVMRRHADGALGIEADSPDMVTRHVLVERRLLKFDGYKTHRETFPTTHGREIIGAILAMDADALVEREFAS